MTLKFTEHVEHSLLETHAVVIVIDNLFFVTLLLSKNQTWTSQHDAFHMRDQFTRN